MKAPDHPTDKKIDGSLIVNKSANIMCKISIGYNAHYLILRVLATPAGTINKTHPLTFSPSLDLY